MSPRVLPLLPALLLAVWPGPTALAQETATAAPPEGHSHIGDAFNEGPRQAAYLMPGMNPEVVFPVSSESEAARAFVQQGVVQLHGFWYFEAERSFRQAARHDPDCAMAYWGMAMANVENEARAHGLIREAWERRENCSERERHYIEALARFHGAAGKDFADEWEPPARRSKEDEQRRKRFVEDLEELIYEHPDDVEAKAFLANHLWLNMRAGISIPSRQANQSILDQVFAAVPNHPAHHYRVHLWDSRETAERVTDSAAAIGHSAPGIAHMWHMAGHIWAKLDRHDDAAWQQEASARVDHAHMMRDRVMPDQIHNYAHNNEWLCRSLRHVGRVRDSISLARNMIELPRHPVWNALGDGYNSSNYGLRRLRETLETFEAWRTTLELAETMYIQREDDPEQRALRARLLARAHHARNDIDGLHAALEEAREALRDARNRRAESIDETESDALAEGKPNADVDEAVAAVAKSATATVRDVLKLEREIEGLLWWCEGRQDEALERLTEVGHDRTHLARLHLEAGDTDKALDLARKAASANGISQPLANLCYVLHTAGKPDEAREKFDELRQLSADFDLDFPPFARLAPLAAELGHPTDWRIEASARDDIGERPPLDQLGPFRWQPSPAPGFELPDGHGQRISLDGYRGKPVLVVFFLGFGCVHCVEQLQALKPVADRFNAAGIEIVTIGTDDLEQLAYADESVDDSERYPFPILADPELTEFKRWRAYDGFEELSLHGTFLVDAQGLVRWQDIGYEPFMDVDFLLGESVRLLGLPTSAE